MLLCLKKLIPSRFRDKQINGHLFLSQIQKPTLLVSKRSAVTLSVSRHFTDT